MDSHNDDLGEDAADSRWLSEETSALAQELGDSLAPASPPPTAVPSISELESNSDITSFKGSPALKPRFGAEIRLKYKEQDHQFVLGRTDPPSLPKSVFKVIRTMEIGERKPLNSVSDDTPHPSVAIAESKSSPSTPLEASSSATTGEAEDLSGEVELVDVELVEHVVNGGSIYKHLISCPEETKNDRHTPGFETVVTLDLVGWIEATKEVFDRRLGVTFRVGEGELGMGMERAVRTMHRGEKSLFTFLPPWPVSLCPNPLFEIPELKNTPVVYEVTLRSFVDAKNPFACKTYEECLEEAQLRREEGNRAHEAKRFTLAITKYTKALLFLEQFGGDFATEEASLVYSQLKTTLHLNLAACNLKLEEYAKVKLHCSDALEIDPKNLKGLYRRASALIALNEFESAHKDLSALMILEPQNALARHLMKRVESKFADDDAQQRADYRRIFTKLEEPDQKPLYEAPPATSNAESSGVSSSSSTTATNSAGGNKFGLLILASVIFVVFLAYTLRMLQF